MNVASATALALLIAGWAVMSGVLSRRNITGPMVFTAAGLLLANPWWGPIPIDVEAASARAVAELTLALILFADASRIDLRALRREASLPVRLLGIGLPLAIALGTAAAMILGPGMSWALALFVGAALAPTDAALSAPVIEDRRVPLRLRRSLNVDSGLNDGIATPVVTLALVMSASALGVTSASESVAAERAFLELVVGAAIGLVVGVVGGLAATIASRRRWAPRGALQIAVLALAIASFAAAHAAGGNAFISAFVGGLAFSGATRGRLAEAEADAESVVVLPELGGEMLALALWFLFGAGLVPVIVAYGSPAAFLYALLALTVLRMVPVAIALIGTGLPRRDVLFLGWFGPRGLASVIFALFAVEALAASEEPVVGTVVATVSLTILLSVLLHGISAGPGAARFGAAGPDRRGGPKARRQYLAGATDDP
ncbi:cation:proton antiporter domain-containing protein [Demequina pelophila]|uniref:cation:proton antiporter domain-containing protein n=1 Tax=Demequina pelophila TaxID=1638984 RepID=UPI0007858E0B|nr:cation:proton antiporter [Demequina pelophila]